MKLNQILSEFPQARLANLIQKWGGKKHKSVSRERLIDQLSALMNDPFNLQKVFNSLTLLERNILGAVLMCDGNVELEQLSNLLKGIEHNYYMNFYISALESAGFFYIIRNKNPAISVPEEMIEPLKSLINKHKPAQPIDENRLMIKDASSIIDDIFMICLFSMNKGGIRLTQQGEIFKKVKQELMDFLEYKGEERLEFAIDIMTMWHLLENDGKMLHVNDENACKIFSKTKEGIATEMIIPLIIMRRINNKLAAEFLDILSTECNENWKNFTDFINTQKTLFFENKNVESWLRFEENEIQRLIDGLYYIGILDLKLYDIQNFMRIHSFKITTFGRKVIEGVLENNGTSESYDRSFIISPNFDVNVFANVPDYLTMYQLGKIAKLIRFDTACTFRLEKEFVLKELTNGSILSDIISFLKTHSKKELPQNIYYSLNDWGSKFGKVKAGKGYIEIIDTSLCEKVEQILSPYIIRSIKNPVIIFDDKKEKEVLLKLRKADIFPTELNKKKAKKADEYE